MTSLFESFKDSLKYWYIPLIVGIVFALVGIYTFTAPLEAYLGLSVIFLVSFIISGIAEIFFAIMNRDIIKGWGWYLVAGIFTLVIGVMLLGNPMATARILALFIGFTFLFRSIQNLGYAFEMRKIKGSNWVFLAIWSVLCLILSIFLIRFPEITGVSIGILTGLTFLLIGINSIILSLNLKKLKDLPEKLDDEVKAEFDSLQKRIETDMSSAAKA